MPTIIENGESMEISERQVRFLVAENWIYLCEDTDCGFYHFCGEPPFLFEEIEEFLTSNSIT